MCYSSNSSCEMKDLACGSQYSMSVTATGPYCSKVSGSYAFQTAPCSPQNVVTRLDCTSNVVTVSWNISSGANSYQSEAIGTNGEKSVCSSTTTSCDFANLRCGALYLVTITANNEASSSKPSAPVEFETAPCVPVQEVPKFICYNNSATLSWSQTSGAIRYVANVTGPEDLYACQTEDTACVINELKCGQTYSATVTAISKQCSGLPSAPVTLTSGPCQPQNVVSNINCLNHSTLLTWEEAPGALRYESSLLSVGKERSVCNSTDTVCEITGLQCGRSYNMTVTAFGNECPSAPSTSVKLYTGDQTQLMNLYSLITWLFSSTAINEVARYWCHVQLFNVADMLPDQRSYLFFHLTRKLSRCLVCRLICKLRLTVNLILQSYLGLL
ncbi:fibronectin type III domain-containing protein 7-like [Dendrobates tinctorius]|uniref:fibronectin type III domain-containing protein 7-like n=1 Tax=Dendrobates tinctorius TaxID=92724 RepID=UPI003CC95BD8